MVFEVPREIRQSSAHPDSKAFFCISGRPYLATKASELELKLAGSISTLATMMNDATGRAAVCHGYLPKLVRINLIHSLLGMVANQVCLG